jgi:hypothetical protein
VTAFFIALLVTAVAAADAAGAAAAAAAAAAVATALTAESKPVELSVRSISVSTSEAAAPGTAS